MTNTVTLDIPTIRARLEGFTEIARMIETHIQTDLVDSMTSGTTLDRELGLMHLPLIHAHLDSVMAFAQELKRIIPTSA